MRLDRRKRRLDPASLRLPLIALIDVVLFLLLYFIFAGSLEAEERQLAVALRTEGGGAAAAGEGTPQVLSVEVGDDGAIFRVAGQVLTDRLSLREAMSRLPREAGINVQVADNAPVWAAAAAVQACHDAGFDTIGYMPAPP